MPCSTRSSGDEERRHDAVELARGVVLHLAVGRDLALQLDQLLGLLVDAAQHLQADRAQEDEQRHHRQERDQELGLHARRHPRHDADEQVPDAHQGSFSRARRSRRNSSGSKRDAEILHAQHAPPVDQRGEERVVDPAARRVADHDPVAARHVAHGRDARR